MEPLVCGPGAKFIDRISGLPTPSLVYDLDGLRRSVELLVDDIATVEGAELNFALKACHTPAVLNFLASLGVGADVASMGELEIAVAAGFPRITATGASFKADDLGLLKAHDVVLDASSIEQLREICFAAPGQDVGLRLRVPLPDAIEDGKTTFGAASRFGVSPTDKRIIGILADTGARLTRLHTHTGQMTPAHLHYKLRYLLTIAEAYPDITEIDLGGGFFSLYASRERAIAAWADVATLLSKFADKTGRSIRVQVEPGGAILAAHGYLVTTIGATETEHPYFDADLLTVDSSAWNFAPWHKPQVVPLKPAISGEKLRQTLIAGNTLYEGDLFGTDVLGKRSRYLLPEMHAGDRLLFTNSGAYTMTNSRRFNRLPLPTEYVVKSGHIAGIS